MKGNLIPRFTGTYAFLSNFYADPLPVWAGSPLVDLEFNVPNVATLEHAFQSAKTLDVIEARAIAFAKSPAVAKALGKGCPLRSDWDQIRERVMLDLLRVKFAGPLGARLLETFPAMLVEGNTWNDRYWGVCDGEGQNRLGTLLMQVRGELRRGRLL